MPISTQELIVVLEKEIGYRRQSGPTLVTRDTKFISEASAVIAKLKADPNDSTARKEARKIANSIESKPLRNRRL